MGPYEVGEEWTRFEIPLTEIYRDTLSPTGIKSVSFKFRREPNFPDHGMVLIDNVAFIKKEGAQ